MAAPMPVTSQLPDRIDCGLKVASAQFAAARRGRASGPSFAAGAQMRCADPKRQALPGGGDAKRALPDTRRTVSGSA